MGSHQLLSSTMLLLSWWRPVQFPLWQLLMVTDLPRLSPPFTVLPGMALAPTTSTEMLTALSAGVLVKSSLTFGCLIDHPKVGQHQDSKVPEPFVEPGAPRRRT